MIQFQAQETVPNITFANQSSVLTTYTSTPDPTESFVSSDTCPETPDSSVKEEADTVNSPDTGSYICLWQDCAEEFVTQKTLVEHINENHMDNKKGCEEFPCMWKDCSRKSKAFNAKYKLITHMRVHTKEKPYLCMVRHLWQQRMSNVDTTSVEYASAYLNLRIQARNSTPCVTTKHAS